MKSFFNLRQRNLLEDGSVRVLSALELVDGRVLPVVRGVLVAGSNELPAPPAGELTQTGIFLPSEAARLTTKRR